MRYPRSCPRSSWRSRAIRSRSSTVASRWASSSRWAFSRPAAAATPNMSSTSPSSASNGDPAVRRTSRAWGARPRMRVVRYAASAPSGFADPAERTRSRSLSSGSGRGGSAIRTSGPSTGATSRMARSASTTSRAPRTIASCSRGTDGSPVTASDARWSRSSLAARLASSSRSAENDRKIQTENGIAHRERTAVTRTCSPTSVTSSSASTIKRMASMQTMNRVGKRIASTRRVRNCGAALVRRAYATSPTTPTRASAATVT